MLIYRFWYACVLLPPVCVGECDNFTWRIVNLTNASRLILCFEVNSIPYKRVPFRYFIAYFAASTCEDVALCRYLDNMFVIIEMFGRVHIPSHLSDPALDYKSSPIFSRTECGRFWIASFLSIGCLVWYGVQFDLVNILDTLARWTNSVTAASWEKNMLR